MEELINNFDFNGYGVRVITNEKNEVFFVAIDVCNVLGYANSRTAIEDNCKIPGVTTSYIGVQTGFKKDGSPAIQQMQYTIISEANLYRSIMRSKMKNAERFQDWVCDEVLPTIRKKGRYEVKAQLPKTNEQILADAVLIAQNVIAEKDEQIKYLAPKAEYTDVVLRAQNTINTRDVAKSIGITAQELNKFLVENHIIYKSIDHYLLYAQYQGKGYEKMVTHVTSTQDGRIKTR